MSNSVTIRPEQVVVQVVLYPTNVIGLAFVPFAVIATIDNQTVFTLPSIPSTMLVVAINGILQSSVEGDFTVVGNQLTLNAGVDIGTLLAGIYA